MITLLIGPFNVIVMVNGKAVGAYATHLPWEANIWFHDGLPFNG
jgi:hypothetical protein